MFSTLPGLIIYDYQTVSNLRSASISPSTAALRHGRRFFIFSIITLMTLYYPHAFENPIYQIGCPCRTTRLCPNIPSSRCSQSPPVRILSTRCHVFLHTPIPPNFLHPARRC